MSRTGLLIIDLQAGFSPSADLVSAIAAECDRHDVVVATQFENPPDSLYRKVLDWHDDAGTFRPADPPVPYWLMSKTRFLSIIAIPLRPC